MIRSIAPQSEETSKGPKKSEWAKITSSVELIYLFLGIQAQCDLPRTKKTQNSFSFESLSSITRTALFLNINLIALVLTCADLSCHVEKEVRIETSEAVCIDAFWVMLNVHKLLWTRFTVEKVDLFVPLTREIPLWSKWVMIPRSAMEDTGRNW